jgi:hypothetical protein
MSRRINNAYAALCAWLTRADENYMGGRLLARAGGHLAAGNLLWLAFEQIAKTLILQEKVPSMPLPEGPPENRSEDLTTIFGLFEEEAKRVRPHHEWGPLSAELARTYPDLDLSSCEATLAKMPEFFSMRYYKEGPHKFSRDEVDTIDSCYFLLRDRIVLDIGMGEIDTLYLLRVNGKLDLYSRFQGDLFEENKAIHPRPGCASHLKFRMAWAGPGMTVTQTLCFPGRTSEPEKRD